MVAITQQQVQNESSYIGIVLQVIKHFIIILNYTHVQSKRKIDYSSAAD
jgi:hypothetical protein